MRLRGVLRLESLSARQQVEDEDNERQDEKDMNPSAERVAADQAENPEDEQDDGDCPKHLFVIDS